MIKMAQEKMKTLNTLIVGTVLALGAGCSPLERVEKVALPESCVEVVNIVRNIRHLNGVHNYDVNCKDREGKYQSYICDYHVVTNLSKMVYSCRPNMTFEPTGNK